MWPSKARNSGWQGVSLVALTYVYFLIFAQFAFLHRLANLGIGGNQLKAVMAAMAVGGILFSLLTPRLNTYPSPNLRLRIAFIACSAAVFFTLLPLGLAACIALSFLIGASIGLLTVTLVTHLRLWTGNRSPLFKVALGTGLGYFACNFPPLFTASPRQQAATAGILCISGIAITLIPAIPAKEEATTNQPRAFSFPRALACFAALVWLDSAAFFIIQNTPALKSGTWQGSAHLWTNGCLHFAAALAAAWFLGRRGLSFLLSAAFLALGAACLLLLDPSLAGPASVFYPIGVSLYSVALVAYPSLIAPASSLAERGRQAGWIYAVAGWCGSVLGIGMGQNLGRVPPAFVLAAAAVVLLPALFSLLRKRKRETALAIVTLLAAVSIEKALVVAHNTPPLTQIERGRRVYISEGCINCHSQYVRPNSPDVLLWGPVGSLEQIRRERPPLIGNRRQGPDLSQIGGRRSPLWLKAHFYNPPEVSGASIMPPFAFLFRDSRGDDLVAYLESLHGPGTTEHQSAEQLWHPSFSAVAKADASDGERLFRRNCATCHSADGRTRQAWKASFKRLPTDLVAGPFTHLPPTDSKAQRTDRLAQIAKFGIPGTDMPGHEYLSDRDIASISLRLSQIDARPVRTDNLALNKGEK